MRKTTITIYIRKLYFFIMASLRIGSDRNKKRERERNNKTVLLISSSRVGVYC